MFNIHNLLIYQLGFVGILPDLGQSNRAVEAEEDAKWKRELLDDNPGLVAEKLDLHGRLLDLLHLKGVDDPDGEIADQEEGYDLSARLAPVLVRAVDPAPGDVLNEE